MADFLPLLRCEMAERREVAMMLFAHGFQFFQSFVDFRTFHRELLSSFAGTGGGNEKPTGDPIPVFGDLIRCCYIHTTSAPYLKEEKSIICTFYFLFFDTPLGAVFPHWGNLCCFFAGTAQLSECRG
jgi:hypothetical protein